MQPTDRSFGSGALFDAGGRQLASAEATAHKPATIRYKPKASGTFYVEASRGWHYTVGIR